ncbi:GATA zinc finger domain-containing protein 10 isoform X3 [Drosophila mojavensis]|uniref:GATA zinc finger domain-containing protein 10 isoform X3 n=1 Tax=Drosophila mojavensis TaxID=7230 RepID=UPI0013EEB2A0|nr:GATA zinc finger domain-containing protein 10 isoform X3 [Drosophila mojavensis]
MSRLTEEMVIARAKQSDLGLIKKLNCWGSDLTDVNIIKRMHGVEVLALSVNKISTLAPFEDCTKLQELYLRKNNIQNINEIGYLQNLPALKYLWLEENPCCERAGPNYRSIVLRALPNLKKLDNVEVTPEELEAAIRNTGPQQADDDVYEDAYEPKQQQHPHPQQQPQLQRSSPQQIQQQQQQQQHQQGYPQQSPRQQQSSPQQQPPQLSHRGSSSPLKEECHCCSSFNKAHFSILITNKPPQLASPLANNSDGTNNGANNVSDLYSNQLQNSMPPTPTKEYYQSDRPSYPAHYRHSQTDLTEWEEHQQPPQVHHNPYGSQVQLHYPQRRSAGPETAGERYAYRNGSARENGGEWEVDDRSRPRRPEGRYSDTVSTVSASVLNHFGGCHRRPVNRNSNLLSATLCLVKELDYGSLEVLEHAVRCRIDELAGE